MTNILRIELNIAVGFRLVICLCPSLCENDWCAHSCCPVLEGLIVLVSDATHNYVDFKKISSCHLGPWCNLFLQVVLNTLKAWLDGGLHRFEGKGNCQRYSILIILLCLFGRTYILELVVITYVKDRTDRKTLKFLFFHNFQSDVDVEMQQVAHEAMEALYPHVVGMAVIPKDENTDDGSESKTELAADAIEGKLSSRLRLLSEEGCSDVFIRYNSWEFMYQSVTDWSLLWKSNGSLD